MYMYLKYDQNGLFQAYLDEKLLNYSLQKLRLSNIEITSVFYPYQLNCKSLTKVWFLICFQLHHSQPQCYPLERFWALLCMWPCTCMHVMASTSGLRRTCVLWASRSCLSSNASWLSCHQRVRSQGTPHSTGTSLWGLCCPCVEMGSWCMRTTDTLVEGAVLWLTCSTCEAWGWDPWAVDPL